MAEILVYTEDERESVNTNKHPVVANVLRTIQKSSKYYGSVRYPLDVAENWLNPKTPSYATLPPFTSRATERRGMTFIRPQKTGNGVEMYTDTTQLYNFDTHYIVSDVTRSGNYALELVKADVVDNPVAGKYINVFNDDTSNTVRWALDTFRCGINVIYRKVLLDVMNTIPIPSWVDTDQLFICVPHHLIYSEDNGTDPWWDNSALLYQVVGRNVKIRYARSTQDGWKQPPREHAWLILAVIPNALRRETTP